jgi:hypothetical protein
MEGFYKNDEGSLLYAPNFINSSLYTLIKEEKNNYVYPIDGWYWFNTKQEAISVLGITETVNLSINPDITEIKNDINNIFDIMNERRLL